MAILKTFKKNNSLRILLIIIVGLVLLSVSYLAVKSNTEQRSRAAQTERIYKAWEFSGATTEGWQGKGGSVGVSQGTLNTSLNTTQPPYYIYVPNLTDVSLPSVGVTKFKIQLSVSPTSSGVVGIPEKRVVKPTAAVTPITGSYEFNVLYSLQGKTGYEAPLVLRGTADGKMQTYELQFPTLLSGAGKVPTQNIQQIRIDFVKGVALGSVVKVDWIRIVGVYEVAPTSAPITSQTIQIIGKVGQDNLEGTSGYYVIDEQTKTTYRLIAPASPTPRFGVVPRPTENILSSYTGKCVLIKGSVVSEDTKGVSIPTSGQKTIRIATISESQGCAVSPTPRVATPTPGAGGFNRLVPSRQPPRAY